MKFGSGRRYAPQQQQLEVKADLSFEDNVDLDGRAVEADLSFHDAAGIDANNVNVEADLRVNDYAGLDDRAAKALFGLSLRDI